MGEKGRKEPLTFVSVLYSEENYRAVIKYLEGRRAIIVYTLLGITR